MNRRSAPEAHCSWLRTKNSQSTVPASQCRAWSVDHVRHELFGGNCDVSVQLSEVPSAREWRAMRTCPWPPTRPVKPTQPPSLITQQDLRRIQRTDKNDGHTHANETRNVSIDILVQLTKINRYMLSTGAEPLAHRMTEGENPISPGKIPVNESIHVYSPAGPKWFG